MLANSVRPFLLIPALAFVSISCKVLSITPSTPDLPSDSTLISPLASDYELEDIWISVDQMPEFPGGHEALERYLSDSLNYPQSALMERVEGRAICQFVVQKDGSIDKVEVVRSSHDLRLDQEARRLVQEMPQWIPGKHLGCDVNVMLTVSVYFSIPEERK